MRVNCSTTASVSFAGAEILQSEDWTAESNVMLDKPKYQEEKKYKVLDLFAGCGGLSKGFELAGFDIVAANEFWEPAQETYQKNHKNTKFFPGDITDPKTKKAIFDYFKNENCDLIIGGPPCQAYSTAGLRNPDDPRGKLFKDYVEIVNHIKPKMFVMENVKGILTMEHDREDLTKKEREELEQFKKLEKEKSELLLLRKQSKNNSERFKFGRDKDRRLEKVSRMLQGNFHDISKFREPVTNMVVKKFKEIGYNVKFKLLNAADYGVPQKRERVIFIGTRSNIEIKHPKPTHNERPQVLLNGQRLLPWVTVMDAIDDLKNKSENVKFNHLITAHNHDFVEKIKRTPVGKGVFGGYSDAFFRNPPNEPARTVKENHGGVLVHYEKNRVMTPRELARLQSFPDSFFFEGSKSNILKQIGNAVPTMLGKAVGNSIKELLKEIDRKSEE